MVHLFGRFHHINIWRKSVFFGGKYYNFIFNFFFFSYFYFYCSSPIDSLSPPPDTPNCYHNHTLHNRRASDCGSYGDNQFDPKVSPSYVRNRSFHHRRQLVCGLWLRVNKEGVHIRCTTSTCLLHRTHTSEGNSL